MNRKEEAENLLNQMTLEEKVSLCAGSSFWLSPENKRLDLHPHIMTDGPHGLRKQEAGADHLGINQSLPAVCFPTAVTSACSFDKDLLHRMGNALGDKCIGENVSVILGPGINMKRSPLCGRNFEYFSKDPYLAGELGAALVEGIQEKGIGASVKHFAVNSQEANRMVIDSVVDKRALHEIYLSAFEKVVKKAKPWTVMCSYNKINGTYANTNKWLLTDLLRKQWEYDGLVVSDWGAVSDRVDGIKAGMDLEMPGASEDSKEQIVKAVQNGTLKEEELNLCIKRLIELILKMQQEKPLPQSDDEKDHKLSKEIAEKSAVLLKNEQSILPLSGKEKIAFIGQMAKLPRYQGAGSSKINAVKVENAYDCGCDAGLQIEYANGYALDKKNNDEELRKEAVDLAKKADIVVIFAGLPDEYESEGFDRINMEMPVSHNLLIKEVTSVNKNVIVVLHCGSPVEMPWKDKVKGILLMYLAGEACGAATIDLLLGKVNPSGKLAETWPIRLGDVPGNAYFPGSVKSVELRESIYIGYRYYNTVKCPVAFPFGFGLSYTQFAYENIKVEPKENNTYDVGVTIKNIGQTEGSEIVQLYISKKERELIFRPVRELKKFEKVNLCPEESKTIHFTLQKEDFVFYDEYNDKWAVEGGEYIIQAGSSSQDILLEESVFLIGDEIDRELIKKNEKLTEYRKLSIPFNPSTEQFTLLLGHSLLNDKIKPYTINSTIGDIKDTGIGKKFLKKAGGSMASYADDESMMRMVNAMLYSTPLRMMRLTGGMSWEQVDGIADMANGHYLRGIRKMKKKK